VDGASDISGCGRTKTIRHSHFENARVWFSHLPGGSNSYRQIYDTHIYSEFLIGCSWLSAVQQLSLFTGLFSSRSDPMLTRRTFNDSDVNPSSDAQRECPGSGSGG